MHNRKYAILAVCCMGLLLVSIDNTIVNVALPSIANELGASIQTLQWTVDAYLLVLASLLLLSGSLADRFGRKRIFMTGMTIFVFGSAMCGLTINETWLVSFRVVQAVGGSMMTPVALAIVTNVFTGASERAKAIGYWAAASGLGIALGPLLGGFLVDAFGWRSIFWVNVPVGLAAIILTARLIPESRATSPRRLDPVGQTLVLLTIASLTFGIIEVPTLGWGSPVIITAFAVAAAGFALLIPYELRRHQPLVEMRLFTNRTFSVAWSTTLVAFMAFAGLLFANTFYLQDSRGLSPSAAGLLSLPLAASVIIAAPISGRLVAAKRTRATLVASGIALTVAPIMLAFFGPSTPLGWIVVPFIIFGVGYGLLNAPVNDSAVSQLPNGQAGVAASLVATSRQLGAVLGVATIGTLVSAGQSTALIHVPSGFGVTVCGVLAACGLAVVLINGFPDRLSSPRQHSHPSPSLATLHN